MTEFVRAQGPYSPDTGVLAIALTGVEQRSPLSEKGLVDPELPIADPNPFTSDRSVDAHTTLRRGQMGTCLTNCNYSSIGNRRKPRPAQKARGHGAASDCRSLESLYFNGIAHRLPSVALPAALLRKGS